MLPIEYILDIYEGDALNGKHIHRFMAATPFMPIRKGDFIAPEEWEGIMADGETLGKLYLVTEAIHRIDKNLSRIRQSLTIVIVRTGQYA